MRTPLLPWSTLVGVSADQPTTGSGDSPRDQGLAKDRLATRQQLLDLVARPEVREALYLGSADLEGSLDGWKESPETGRGPGIELSLLRYLVRAGSRPTPFGLFAGTSIGRVGERTLLQLDAREHYRRHSRIAISCLTAAASAVATSPEAAGQIQLAPNPTLYRVSGALRWFRPCDGQGSGVALMSAPESPRLHAALTTATNGRKAADLVEAMAGDGRDYSMAAAFVDRLVQLQLLVPTLDVRVTGREPMHDLVEQFAAAGATRAQRTFAAVAHELATFDDDGLGVSPERYRRLARSIAGTVKAGLPSALFGVDLVKPAPNATLGRAVIAEISRAVTVLHRITPRRPPGDLGRFVDAFVRRYGGREVPLLEAVDAEAGVGFGTAPVPAPLVSLTFPPAAPTRPPMTNKDDFLLGRLLALAGDGRNELVLDDGDIDSLASTGSPPPLPGAFAVVAQVGAASQEALDAGDFSLHVRSVGGPSGAWLLGRFCHADPQLRLHVEQHLRTEEAQDPDAIWAEVVYLPDGQLGNVIVRPQLRRYEIPCFGSSGSAARFQISLGDLVLCVRDGTLVLRSRRLGRRIVVRGTTAHDFSRSGPAVYRLLASLQTQGVSGGLAWSWGALTNAPFLPRVSHRRVVLSLARWRVSESDLAALHGLSGAALLLHLRRWRAGRRIPPLVSLVDSTGGLLVNLENIVSAESFLQLVRTGQFAVLEEIFPAPDQLCATGPEGAFAHELVVPFTAPARPPATVPGVRGGVSIRRRFAPGSEWISTRVYSSAASVDRNLADIVGPLARRLVASGDADTWFFLRYGDPDWHLRFRVHVDASRNPAAVLHEVCRVLGVLVQEGRATRFEVDTYEREVERYGGPEGIRLAEQLFSIDSAMVVDLLTGLPGGDGGADERWLVAVRSVDQLLDDLGVVGDDRLAALERGRAIYAHEHRLDGGLEASLSKRFRADRARLDEALAGGPAGSSVAACTAALDQRSRRVQPLAAGLRALQRLGRLSDGVDTLATSFVHLHLNRLLSTAHRAQELVVYDTLLRVERSRRARLD